MLYVIHQIMVSRKSVSATWWQYLHWPALHSHRDACNLFFLDHAWSIISKQLTSYHISTSSLSLTHRYSLNWNPAMLMHGRLNYFQCQSKKESLNSSSKSNKILLTTLAFILMMIFNILTLTPFFDKDFLFHVGFAKLKCKYKYSILWYKILLSLSLYNHPAPKIHRQEIQSGVDWENTIHHFGCPLAVTPALRWYPWSRRKHCSWGEDTSDQPERRGQKALSIQKRH